MTLRYQRRQIGGTVVEIEQRIRSMDLNGVTVNAEEGSTALSKYTLDDPDGDYDVTGHRLFAVYEDEALDPDDQYIAVGYIQRRRYKRGRSMLTGSARIIEVDVADLNTILGRRVMTGEDCDRPAETDVERMQWAVLTNEASLIDDDRYLSTENPVDMDACDYRGQYLMSVLEDCAEASGKNYFVTWFGPAFEEDGIESPWGTFSIFYDFVGSEVYDSSIFLTNDMTVVDGLNVFDATAELERSPDAVYSGIKGDGDGITDYEQNATTVTNFARRDMVASFPNVKTAPKLEARILRMLDDIDEEDDRLTISFLVDPVNVNRLKQGQRVRIKFPHLGAPGDYDDWRWVRMLTRSTSQTTTETGDRLYLISGDFSGNPVVVGTPPGGGGGGGEEPPPDIDPPMDVMSATIETGESGAQADTAVQECVLYDGCTYRASFSISHSHGGSAVHSNYLTVALWRYPGPQPPDVGSQTELFRANVGAERLGTAQASYVEDFTTTVEGTAGVSYSHYQARLQHTAYALNNGYGSSFVCTITYLSGPDPGSDMKVLPARAGEAVKTGATGVGGARALQTATQTPFTPTGSIAATNVQDAIMEAVTEAGSGGAPTTADYSVGTAQGGLSAEIVVGTTPGGELGGTWSSPTVDSTHSGSAHADFIAKSFFAAKGDLIGASANDTPSILSVGTNGYRLKADSAETTGLKWVPDYAAIPFLISGGALTITTGSKGFVEVPFDCTIQSVRLAADQAGAITITIKKATYSGLFTLTSIVASAKPTLSGPAQKSEDTTLTGWTTSLSRGDWLEFVVDTITTCTQVTVSLGVIKT